MARLLAFLTLPLLLAPAAVWADPPAQTSPMLQPAECGGLKRLHVWGDIFLAGQPQPADFVHAERRGIRTVVNLRLEDELSWNEADLVRVLGMEYASLPFRSPESLTDELFDQSRALLNDAERHPLLLHCASANRVGALWLAHRVLDRGVPFEEALAEAKTVGLSTAAFVDRAREYIEARREK